MRALVVAALILIPAGTTACGGANRAGERGANAAGHQGPVKPVAVSDADFARSAYQVLLSSAPSQQRTDLLAGVVRRQLARAGSRFQNGQPQAGLSTLTGAFYLMRAGEARREMIDGSAPALMAGAAEVSRLGNEGKAQALYTMLQQILPPGKDRQDVDAHLAALARWSASTQSAGPMQAAGRLQRAATQRALYDASVPALHAAREATIAWIRRALESNIAEMPIRTSFERDEALEAYRAIRAGGASLIALYLRHGDARGALDAIDRAELTRAVPPSLRDRLERIAEDDDANAWADLYRLFDSADDADHPEASIDQDLARAATWGCAVGLYRSEPNSMRGARGLSVLLFDYGMAEVAPAVVGAALTEQPTAEDVSWGMAVVHQAVVVEDEIGDLPAARRSLDAAAPILEVARGRFTGRVRPSAARLHFLMGTLETRAGELARARPHMDAAARAEPSVDAFTALAAIDRQRGDAKGALNSLGQVITLAKRTGDPIAEAEALLTSFEIHRDAGRAEEAKQALQAALRRTLDARQLARNGANQARAERLLARILEHYGDEQATRRALERAYEASSADVRQLAATVLDASRSALTRGDLASARDAVRRAVEARLPDEDLVYVALWLQLLEKKVNTPSDGTAEEAYAAIDEASGWPAKLRSWGRGKLSDDALLTAATSRVEKTEAMFYTAMANVVQGRREVALPKLREVAKSETIALVEVTIARDLLAQQAQPGLALSLPPNLEVP
jgi:cellulose synthase operon protein C